MHDVTQLKTWVNENDLSDSKVYVHGVDDEVLQLYLGHDEVLQLYLVSYISRHQGALSTECRGPLILGTWHYLVKTYLRTHNPYWGVYLLTYISSNVLDN